MHNWFHFWSLLFLGPLNFREYFILNYLARLNGQQCHSVQHCSPVWNMSTTTGWTDEIYLTVLFWKSMVPFGQDITDMVIVFEHQTTTVTKEVKALNVNTLKSTQGFIHQSMCRTCSKYVCKNCTNNKIAIYQLSTHSFSQQTKINLTCSICICSNRLIHICNHLTVLQP